MNDLEDAKPVDTSAPPEEAKPAEDAGTIPETEAESAGAGDPEELMVPAALLRQVEAERDRFKELSQRTRADLENYRKRVAREHEQLKRESLAGFLSEFLAAFDDMDRTLAEGEKNEDYRALLDGIRLVRQNLWKTMASAGVRKIEAEGARFDPAIHEAMTMIPMPGKEPNTVVDVFQSGFMLDDFVLRPARVVVAAPLPSAAEDAPEADEDE